MNATVKRFIQERNSIKSIFRGAKNSRVSIRGTKRSCRILTLKFHEEIFTKVTPPLGSRAFSVWVRVPSGAPPSEQAILRLLRLFYWSAPAHFAPLRLQPPAGNRFEKPPSWGGFFYPPQPRTLQASFPIPLSFLRTPA